MLTVRAARTDDLGAIVKLERYCFPPEVAFGRSRWHYLLSHARGRTLLLLDEKAQLMGYLSVLEHRGWDRLIIQTLAIRWTVRRQGWARRLLEQVDERWGSAAGYLREQGVTDAELAALEQRLAKTRALKQGMMQELLTGRTRLL